MSNERFDDELLSAIIDGEADEATVADAYADPVTAQRLDDLQIVIDLIGEEPPAATPERRQASIAAALAAATPAPEVTSLSAERAARRGGMGRTLLTAAAAIVLVLVLIPVVASLRSGGSDTASVSDAADTALGADAAGDVADEVEDAVTDDDDEAMEDDSGFDDEDEAMEDDAMEDDEEDEAMEDGEDAAPATSGSADESADAVEEFAAAPEQESASPSLAERLADVPPAVPIANSVNGIDDLLALGSILPEYDFDELIDAGVNPQCLADVDLSAMFGAVFVDVNGADPARLVVVEFVSDGTTRFLDSEDCALLG